MKPKKMDWTKPMEAPPADDLFLRVDYTREQVALPVTVRDFLLCERDGRRVCLVRFARAEEIVIDGLRVRLTTLDAAGVEIESRMIHLRDSDLPPIKAGELLVPTCGIPVDDRTTEVILDILEVASGDYRYRAVGGHVELDYAPAIPWRYDPHAGEDAGLSDTVPLQVTSGRSAKVRGLWPVAVLAFLLLMGYLLSPLLSLLRESTSNDWELFAATHIADGVVSDPTAPQN